MKDVVKTFCSRCNNETEGTLNCDKHHDKIMTGKIPPYEKDSITFGLSKKQLNSKIKLRA